MKSIEPRTVREKTVVVPGSKSISHRMIMCASLAEGKSVIGNLLGSRDVLLTVDALRCMGADIRRIEGSRFEVLGIGGKPAPYGKKIYLGNSGTSMRFLACAAGLGSTEYVLTGDERMCHRPMSGLLEALNMIDISAESGTEKTPLIHIRGRSRKGGDVIVDCSRTGQYLSSLLMIGGLMEKGLNIRLKGNPVSSPYIDLTIDVMKKFNIHVDKLSRTRYIVPGKQIYENGSFVVEPDLSSAGYFWAAGAITGNMLRVGNIPLHSLQGDLKQLRIFERMGCKLYKGSKGVGVCGNSLRGVDVSMSDMPDAVPAVAVVAGFASGRTRISDIGHLRGKECDRIRAVSSQLSKMGIRVAEGEDFIEIYGGKPRGAVINTFNDHRIAMAFSIAGLVAEGVRIENEKCVEKSFPGFWNILDSL